MQGIRVNDTIYVSGPGSHDEKGLLVGKSDMETQLRQTYINAAKVLQQFGATMNNVLKEEVFVTDMNSALVVAAEVRADVYLGKPLVASTIVQVDRLISPELLVQVKLTAKVHGQ
ncbi:MAG: hypothetical protein NPIRA02_41910 [Nitrospirales bacterium]|nr:MAG: hypothetical protein NPIRA02_41910 [Nitrospirales bacterium]